MANRRTSVAVAVAVALATRAHHDAPIPHGNDAVTRAVCAQGLGRDGWDWGQEGPVVRGGGRLAVWRSA